MIMRTRRANLTANTSCSTSSGTCSLGKCLVTAAALCFTAFQLYSFNADTVDTSKSSLLLLDEHGYHYSKEPTEEAREGQEQGQNDTLSSPSPFILESFAISFDPSQVEKLQERNKHANIGNVLWVPGTDGMHQRTLDLWTKVTKHQHSPMTMEEASKLPRGHYESPHAVGVYLAHWTLLRTLAHRPVELLQQQHPEPNKHAYLILEDDAACAPGLNEEIERTIEKLPSDWDILFVGGKPFTSFDTSVNNHNNHSLPTKYGEQLIQDYNRHEAASNWTATDETNQLIRHAICKGHYGKANVGPLAPDGSRRLSQEQAYWRLGYLTNTHSYVVNPKRVAHVAQLLYPSMDVPVDIRMGDLMKSGTELNAYMTTRMWCDQMTHQPLLEPQTWKGFFVFVTQSPSSPGRTSYDWKYIWQTQMHLDDENCAF